METQLIKLRIKKGKEARAHEWMAWLNARKKEGMATLKHEKVFLEAVFSSYENGRMYLYYYTVAYSIVYAMERFNEQKYDIDRIHRRFAQECVDTSYKGRTFNEELLMVNISVKISVPGSDFGLPSLKNTINNG